MSLSQVGFDEETQSFDIDKMTTGITASKKSKILTIRETISALESRLGKLIPQEELEKALSDKITASELEDSLTLLEKEAYIFKPRKGFIQRM